MKDYLKVAVRMHSGKSVEFHAIQFGQANQYEENGVKLTVGDKLPFSICAQPLDSDRVRSIEFTFYTDIRNYHSVIVPDSGRWFFNSSRVVSFWRNFRELQTGVDDTKLSLLLFTGKDRYTALAVGVIGENYETAYKLIEPESNRALNVHTGYIVYQFKRGTDKYPIPDRISQQHDDGSITEYIYYRRMSTSESEKQPWMMTIREFTNFQRSLYSLQDPVVNESLHPIWCTWADWHSNDITSDVILDNVRAGVELGITNYIIDDGWFGPGLDNDYSVPLNIGDWEPDPDKIPDMVELVKSIKNYGAKPIIWCAPHAVAAAAECYPERKRLLIADESGNPILNPTQFYSLCFMNEEARNAMADICIKFIDKWDFDGAKYDLFNWVPNVPCCNPDHQHDVTTMLEGLEKTLALIEERTRERKPAYIVELKQNYGTPFFSRYGTMMRAGDGPFDPESNFLRTLFIQGYTPYALNDYQIITGSETPEDTAVAVIKMIAAGIPAYSVNFTKLSPNQLEVIRHLNRWYLERLNYFHNNRIPQDADANVITIAGDDVDIVFAVNSGGIIELKRDTLVLNGTYNEQITVRMAAAHSVSLHKKMTDCYGTVVEEESCQHAGEYITTSILPGGMLQIAVDQ
ncbi:melibiase [Paenibacillus cellulosilyticus]|uniref:Melibiase n=1 Tax=Paenibacillus cellulosilyticus TaxID=375489 RepID=A0A2V2YMW8_9BACL|nr:alpha-galactosidase [Paenibacillus cellulosilyticus]PWV95918.1 melibiase [Paenibacillus cellulosilyticus]QKS47782.1 alpha-galactosidase [Paenibacillus cellulosilyticus]